MQLEIDINKMEIDEDDCFVIGTKIGSRYNKEKIRAIIDGLLSVTYGNLDIKEYLKEILFKFNHRLDEMYDPNKDLKQIVGNSLDDLIKIKIDDNN